MGMLDSELIFSAAQTVTSTGDTASTNVYDTGASYNNAQNASAALTNENLWIQALVNTTVTSGGAATVAAVFQDSPDNSTWTDRLVGPVVALASLTAGTPLLQVQPPIGTQRYYRIAYRVATAALTAGKFDAYISNTIAYNVQRPSGIPAVG